MSRPWSAAEVEERIPPLIDALHDQLTELTRLREDKAATERAYRSAKSRAFLLVQGKNKEEREARAYLHQVEPNVTVGDLGYLRDLAAGAYWDGPRVIQIITEELATLRTLHVSAREATR